MLVTSKQDENFPKKASFVSTQAEPTQLPKKKIKSYSVTNVMQQATFQGMERVIKYVDEHVKQLTSIIDNINECGRYLIKKIKLLLTNSYIDSEIIKLTFQGNKEDIAA